VPTKQADDESVFAKNEARETKRRVERLKREATALGFDLAPKAVAAKVHRHLQDDSCLYRA
jgi:hypothetical protein